MKFIVNISLVLVVLLSSTVFAAKQKKSSKKSAAESKKAVVEPNEPAAEPNVSVSEALAAPVSEPNTVSAPVATEAKDANQSDAAAVTVNGVVITEGQVEAIVNPRMEQMGGRVPENMVPQYRQQIRMRVIDQLVVEEILAQKEKQNNIDVNQSEIDQQINKVVAKQNLTLDEFKALLKAYGTSFSDYQQNMRKRLMFEKLMDKEFAEKLVKPTDEQAKEYYDENIQQFNEPEKIHAKHILIRPAEDANNPEGAKAKAKAQAQEILDRIKAGESFEELAKQYSACPSGRDGGDLGVQPKGAFVPEFEKAAFALKPGKISDIVETSFGYHIIKLIEHIDANTTTFEQAKDQIKEILIDKQKEQIVIDYIQKIRAEADIKYANQADKPEPQTDTGKAAPMRKRTEKVQPSDEKKPASDKADKSNKD